MYTYHEHRIRVPQAAVLRVESHCPPSRHPRTKLVLFISFVSLSIIYGVLGRIQKFLQEERSIQDSFEYSQTRK